MPYRRGATSLNCVLVAPGPAPFTLRAQPSRSQLLFQPRGTTPTTGYEHDAIRFSYFNPLRRGPPPPFRVGDTNGQSFRRLPLEGGKLARKFLVKRLPTSPSCRTSSSDLRGSSLRRIDRTATIESSDTRHEIPSTRVSPSFTRANPGLGILLNSPRVFRGSLEFD